jgi:hypothetical protein
MQNYKYPLFIRYALFFNGFEHFLTSLKVIFTPLIPFLFFSEQNTLEGIFFLFQIYPLGLLAKPLGTLFFQYLEKKQEISFLLKISYVGTGSASMALGIVSFFFPEFLKAGLVFFRFFQSFFSANEITGITKAILDIADTDTKKRVNSWISTSSMLGIWFAFCFVLILDQLGKLRISFFVAHALGFFLILGSFHLPKLPEYRSFRKIERPKPSLWATSSIFLLSGFSAFCYSASFLAIPSCFLEKNLLWHQASLVTLDVILVWIFGKTLYFWKKMDLLKGSLSLGVLFPLFWFAFPSLFSGTLTIQLFLIFIGTMFSAPLYPYLYEKSLVENQYSVLSWGYLIGSQLFGSMTPLLILKLQSSFQLENGVLLITFLLSMITLLFLNFEREEPKEIKELS